MCFFGHGTSVFLALQTLFSAFVQRHGPAVHHSPARLQEGQAGPEQFRQGPCRCRRLPSGAPARVSLLSEATARFPYRTLINPVVSSPQGLVDFIKEQVPTPRSSPPAPCPRLAHTHPRSPVRQGAPRGVGEYPHLAQSHGRPAPAAQAGVRRHPRLSPSLHGRRRQVPLRLPGAPIPCSTALPLGSHTHTPLPRPTQHHPTPPNTTTTGLKQAPHARIISGNEEGGFGWIAFNYLKKVTGTGRALLDKFTPPLGPLPHPPLCLSPGHRTQENRRRSAVRSGGDGRCVLAGERERERVRERERERERGEMGGASSQVRERE